MTYNRLEDTIQKLYLKIDVTDVIHLDFELIATRLGFSVIYIKGISKYIASLHTFCLEESLTQQEQWQDFGHELCHAIWHAGHQLSMPIDWRLYQEWQANSFAYEACVPRYLLEHELAENTTVHPVALIAEKFGVTQEFALCRYWIHMRKMSQEQSNLFQNPDLYYGRGV